MENIGHVKGHPHFAYTLDSVMNRSLMLKLVDAACIGSSAQARDIDMLIWPRTTCTR